MARGAGRPRGRVGGRDRARAAAGRRGRRRRGRLRPAGHRGGQVLGLQAGAGGGRRGAGMPWRQRVRRGVRDAAAVPGVAAQLDLGGLRQRHRARRAAGAGPGAGGGRGRAGRGGRGGRRGRALDAVAKQLRADLSQPPSEAAGRQVAARIALALQGSLLVRHAPAPVADAFCATRLVRTGRPACSVSASRPRPRWWTGPHRPARKSPHRSCRDGRRRSDPLLFRKSRAREHP